MRYRHGVATNRGLVRATNEDSYMVRNRLYVVCDGMGGASAGEIASQIACQSLLALDPRRAAEDDLRKAVEEANEAIVERSLEEDTLMGMGTTLTAALAGDHDLVLAHVGDSRAYLLREGKLQQITEDHSWVGELVRRGELTAAQAAVHPHRSVITRALGTESDIEPDIVRLEVKPGDRLVLCTDGLSGMVPDARLASILTGSDDVQAIADSLVQEALAEGGEDNVTVVVIFVEGKADEAEAGASEPGEDGDDGFVELGPVDRGVARGKSRDKARAPKERVRQRFGAIQAFKRAPDTEESTAADDALPVRAGLEAAVAAAAADPATSAATVGAAVAGTATTGTAADTAADAQAPAAQPAEPQPAAPAAAQQAVGQAAAKTSQARAAAAPAASTLPAKAPKRRRSRKLLVALIVVLVIVIAVAGFGVFDYSVYYVGNYDGNVALFHGMPGKVLGISLSRAIEVGPATYGQLAEQQRAKVNAHSLTSKEEGQKFLRSLTSLP